MSVYNDAEYLRVAIESVLSQQGIDLELVIVDDGSIDESPQILKEYTARDSRIRVIRGENKGLTRALVTGCNAARAKYIARQDADDISLPGRLRMQADLLKSDDRLVFVSCFSEVIAPGGEVVVQHKRPGSPEAATNLLLHGHTGPPGHGTVMFRKDAYFRVGGYRWEFYFSQDSDLWYRLAEVGLLGYCPKILYQYRLSPKSLSGNRSRVKALYADCVHRSRAARIAGQSDEKVLQECANLRVMCSSVSAKCEASTLYFLGRNLLRSRPLLAADYLIKCLRLSPCYLRAIVCLFLVPLFVARNYLRW